MSFQFRACGSCLCNDIIDNFFFSFILDVNKQSSVVETNMSFSNGNLSKAQKRELEKELKGFATKVEDMTLAKQKTIEHLYDTANYLDKVWRDCKIASIAGNSAGILGGLLTIGGGIATVLTAGAASPLLIAGISLGAVGASTNLGTAATEAAINSAKLQEAEEALKGADELTKIVKEQIREWKEKDVLRLCFLTQLAVQLFGQSHIVVQLIQSVLVSVGISADIIFKICAEAAIKTASEVAAKAGAGAATISAVEFAAGALLNNTPKLLAGATEGATAGAKGGASTIGKAGAKMGAKAAGGVIIGVSSVFLAWDAVDLGFNIRDLVEDIGCKAAPFLREKAKELEASLAENITNTTKK